MGLLGDSWDDPRTMGTLQLAAGLLSPGSLGQGISRGLLGYQQSMKAAQDMEVAQTEQALRKAQVDQAMQKTKAELYAAARKQQFLGALGQQFAGVTPQQALAAPGQMAPTPANPMQWPPQPAAARPGQLGPTLERAELIGQRVPVDWQQMMADGMAAGVTPEQIKALAEAQNFGRQKVARVEETVDAQGHPIKRQFSEFGDQVGGDMGVWKDKQVVNFGDAQYTRDPVSGRLELLRKNGMTPDSAASNALGWANHRLSGQRLAFDQSGGAEAGKPQYKDGQWVMPPRDMRPGETRSAVPQAGVRDATEALALINQAKGIIPNSTGSYLGVAADHVARAAGFSLAGDEAAAQLKAIEGALVSKMPKMSGPQSDKDVLLYRQMAGEIGDPTIPHGRRLAALKEIKKIQQRYAGIQPDQPQQPKAFDMLPAASQFAGRRMQAPNGAIYRSDGTKWIKE